MKKSLVIFAFLFCIACGEEKPKKPDNLISESKMENMLYDLYVINAAKGVNRALLERNGLVPEKYILNKYNVDSTLFAESNTYYAFEPETYQKIVDNVKARLEEEKEAYEEIQKEEGIAAKKRRDSIVAAREAERKAKDSLKVNLKSDIKVNKQLKEIKEKPSN